MEETILLLDDQVTILKDLGTYLRRRGYGVHTTSSAEEAKKIVETHNIDYAIVDLKIDFETEFGGIMIVNFVKSRQPKAKVIVLSAYAFNEEIQAKLEFEVDGYILKGSLDNYILSVLNTLEEFQKGRKIKTCFVITPLSRSKSCREKDWTEIFRKLIKPAVEQSGYNYQCIRSEALHGNIIEGIIEQLHRAELVIADLTDKNPNVFYELGVRHTLGGCTILIAQDLKFVPFDLRHLAIQIYDWRVEEGREGFKTQIKDIIKLIETHPERALSPVRKYINLIESPGKLTPKT